MRRLFRHRHRQVLRRQARQTRGWTSEFIPRRPTDTPAPVLDAQTGARSVVGRKGYFVQPFQKVAPGGWCALPVDAPHRATVQRPHRSYLAARIRRSKKLVFEISQLPASFLKGACSFGSGARRGGSAYSGCIGPMLVIFSNQTAAAWPSSRRQRYRLPSPMPAARVTSA